MKWTKTGWGWSAYTKGIRWTVKGPIFGKPIFWLYRDGFRVKLDDSIRYDDSLNFLTAKDAKAFVDKLLTPP